MSSRSCWDSTKFLSPLGTDACSGGGDKTEREVSWDGLSNSELMILEDFAVLNMRMGGELVLA